MISIALADDNELFRKGLKNLLKLLKMVDVLFDAKNGQDLLGQLSNCTTLPDIILMDFNMPILDGRETTKIIKEQYTSIKVIMLSVFHHEYLVSSLIAAGARGFLSKNIDMPILERAITIVNDKQYFIEIKIGEYKTYDNFYTEHKSLVFRDRLGLTDKQKQFIQLVASGDTYEEIAIKMGISGKTANNYRDLFCKRFNVSNRLELVLFAIRTGLIDITK
jgi:two-component system invasion response regulator UvrY